jgi:ATP-dependent DNA ligase
MGANSSRRLRSSRLEGIVSKRRDQSYRSGPRGGWLKIKCAAWLAANKNQWEMVAR